mmetsp:Transcript_5870/g.16717  ORF Transcript_5870/g.16717 Transcript_5870/m.16717 type:complete len:433 (-) Transcript_5870:267-1565(-)|eukprot:CAMPEP_0172356992 /NCGR_PEP_ID=MMETSP1060-20121228/1366_1 /TAXON_ID=37318 /ORGANISM="Pseudo-nitzschia pungens, Strain cf. cingulata" /LENGTH=432 /DNA_ID=CAMNT_0013077425 /DNA_START=113 /DNA_END=1411 /DNA_ORIENTATION=+
MAMIRVLLSLAALLAFLGTKCHAESSTRATIDAQKAPDPESALTFEAWERLHSNAKDANRKQYSSATERSLREQIFYQNKIVVEAHNAAYQAGHTSWKMTLSSPFADLTSDEFATLYLMDPQECSATTTTTTTSAKEKLAGLSSSSPLLADDTTVSVDWRTKGIMTPVKDQGMCGSCWTFSTSGCLEAHTCLAYGKDCTHWKGLAEQQLVDCAGDFNNFGCNGGLPSQAYEYLLYNGGMDLETSYSYTASDGDCKAADGTVGAKVAEVYNITSGNEDDLVTAVAGVGPVSIAYQVSPDFRFYQHGVYDSYNATTHSTMCHNANTDVNHAVVAVGLGTTAPAKHNHDDSGGIPYYIVRNSWGTSWGMEGHFWMKRGENLCGVSDCASFPLVPKTKAKANAKANANADAEQPADQPKAGVHAVAGLKSAYLRRN